jgi:hypothetical protein
MSGVLEADVYVKISNNIGFSFGDVMVIGSGIIGEALVGSEDSVSETFTNPQAIDIRRGRERQLDVYNTGSASVTVQDSATWNPLIVTGEWADKVVPGIQMKVWAEFPSIMLSCTGSGGLVVLSGSNDFVPDIAQESLDFRIAFVVTEGLNAQTAILANLGSTVSTRSWTVYLENGTLNLDAVVTQPIIYKFTSAPLPYFRIGTAVSVRIILDGVSGKVSFFYWQTAPVVSYDAVISDTTWELISTEENGPFFTAFLANSRLLYQSVNDLDICKAPTSYVLYDNPVLNLLAYCLKSVSKAGVYTIESAVDMTDGFKQPGMTTFTDYVNNTVNVTGSSIASVNFEYPLFAGFISSFNYDWTKGVVGQNTVTFIAEDAFRPLNLVEVETVTGALVNDLPGTRITQILDTVGYPTSGLNVSTGTTFLQDDADEVRTVLPLLQAVAEADLGSFYADETGFVRYESRISNARRQQSTPIYFDDVAGNGYDYQAISVSYDDDLITNDISIDNGGDVQQATDADSIAKYFRRSMSKTGLLMENESDALFMAQTILASRKEPIVRVERLGLDITKTPAPNAADKFFRLVPTVLSIEFGTPFAVTKNWYQTDPDQIGFNPTTLSSTLVVEGIDHMIRPDRWIIEFTTSEPMSAQFFLDNETYGSFGNTLSY